jgi:hypothetical protein
MQGHIASGTQQVFRSQAAAAANAGKTGLLAGFNVLIWREVSVGDTKRYRCQSHQEETSRT